MNHGWQSEDTDGPTGGWGLISFSLSLFVSLFVSLFLWLSIYLPIYLSTYLSTYLSVYLPIYLSTYLSIYLSIYLPICLSTYLPIYLSTYLPIYLSIDLSIYRSFDLSIYRSIDLSIYRSICLSIYLSIYRSIDLSIYLSVCLSIYLSICKLENQAILRDFFIIQSWQHQKRSNSARPPQCLNLTTSKMKQFCETSSMFELDNVKNEAILRDFLNISTWQRQKRTNSARLLQCLNLTTSKTKQFCETSFKNGKLSAALTASYQCVLRFFHSTCLKYCASHEKVRPGHTKCCTCHAKSSSQNWRSDAPKRNLSQKISAPPNISDEHVSCTAPATQNGIWTSKSAPNLVCFVHFDFEMCFAPQRRALFRHLNFNKCSDPGVLCTFWLRNVLRATTACNFLSLIWPAGSAPAALASLLFDPPEPQIIEKTCVSRLSYLFAHLDLLSSETFSFWIFFLLLFCDSSHLCFSSVHIVGSLTSKLLSMKTSYSRLIYLNLLFPTRPKETAAICNPPHPIRTYLSSMVLHLIARIEHKTCNQGTTC